MKPNFIATVKERDADEPCFIVLENYEDIGTGRKQVILSLPKGTGIGEAEALKKIINDTVEKVGLL
jgi:hypothetical protein